MKIAPINAGKSPAKRKAKPAYQRTISPKVSGATAPSGIPYVKIEGSGKTEYRPLRSFIKPADVREDLASQGLILMGEPWSLCLESVQLLKAFPPEPLLERPGWTRPYIALPDGRAFGPRSAPKPIVLFKKQKDKCRRNGTLNAWLAGMDNCLEGQLIAQFAVMAPFAAPLLILLPHQGNVGWELAGAKGKGKTTLVKAAASVIGAGADPQVERNYWVSANATASALEDQIPAHADNIMIIEEMNLYAAGEAPKNRASKFDELIFRISSGIGKSRHKYDPPMSARSLFMASTNEPLAQLLAGHREAVSSAAADRWLTLPISLDRPYGVFDVLPDRFPDSGALAKELLSVIEANHGRAMTHFLKRYVEELATDETALKDRIERYLQKFRKNADVDRNSGSAMRVADAFGLVYAAGCLAKAWGALPERFTPGPAALACYHLNRSVSGEPISMFDRLKSLATHKDAVIIDPDNLPQIPDADFNATPAFIYPGRKGREVLVPPRMIERHFPVLDLLLGDTGVKETWRHDADHKTVKRSVRANKTTDRLWCFDLSVED